MFYHSEYLENSENQYKRRVKYYFFAWKKVKALEKLYHSVSDIGELEGEAPDNGHWDEILEVIVQAPTDRYLDSESL